MSDPYGGRPWPPPGWAGGPPSAQAPSAQAPSAQPPSAQPPRWTTVGLPVGLIGLVVALLAAYLVVDARRGVDPRLPTMPAAGSALPSSELDGQWSGEGSLTRCAGFDDQDCPETRSITLTIDCSQDPCAVTPFRRGYGSPPLPFEDGEYQAAGPVPPEVAPTCGGTPTRSALWRLHLVARDGRLGGTYSESTVQGFDCGATGVEWQVVLERT
ncbi:hypothetical protein [Blastococcus deserti]|uniref:Subtilisin inhibitor-like n=1 Tax=Blastococcus deserti TaxID=2259033 RepID=A0ABW4XD98_9ACTN